MIHVCVICMVKRPPLSPMEAEYRRLLEAVVSPLINTEDLNAFQWLLCTNCKPLLQAVHNFQQTALAGVKNLKHLLRKLNTAQIEGRNLRVVTIKIEPNTTAAPKEEFIKIEPTAAPMNVDPLTEELVLKLEPESEHESELEPACDSDSRLLRLSCDPKTNAQSNEKPTTTTQPVQVIPKMGATAGIKRKFEVFTHKAQPRPASYLSSIRWKDGVREGSKIKTGRKPSRVACPHCGKFVLNTSLRTHIIGVHGEWARCKCDVCGKLFRNPLSLTSHKNSHKKNTTIDDLRPELYCQQCARPFPNRSVFRAHLMTLKHTPRDQYQFECETCKRRFPDETRRQHHIDVVHLGLRTHKCDQCDKTYTNASNLRKHVAVFHEKRAKLPQHVCHLCGKSFTVRKSLNEHLLTHEGLRPHQCPLCPATFTYKAALFTHNRLKHLKVKGKWKKKKKVAEKAGKQEEEKADSNY